MAPKTKRAKSSTKFMNNIMDDIFHHEEPICQIIPTSTVKKKQDIFDKYRPLPKTCLDYKISQTDAKLDAGATKIHVQETVANYYPYLSDPPPPKPRKVKSYFSGGPPQWEFVDEIWRRKQDELQILYHKQFKERVKKRKKNQNKKFLKTHAAMLARQGPPWFQELSPKQLTTVDNLKYCIYKDLAEGTVCNTKENIAYLGVLLRPNSKHIENALKNCCKCPVEFLLILYQMINPKRTKYSSNDKLLLSAVVHLTMMDTLRELHIRIPSPPPPRKKTTKPRKEKKRTIFESPYLEPYTFKPSNTDNYICAPSQRPQSPYFAYLKNLKTEIKLGQQFKLETRQKYYSQTKFTSSTKLKSKSPDQPKSCAGAQTTDPHYRINFHFYAQESDEEINEEAELAQTIYEELADYKPVRRLLKPSRYRSCKSFEPKPVSTSKEIEIYLTSNNPRRLKEDDKEIKEKEEEQKEQEKDDAEVKAEEEINLTEPSETQPESICYYKDASENCCEDEITQQDKSFEEQVEEKAGGVDELPKKVEEFSSCGCKEIKPDVGKGKNENVESKKKCVCKKNTKEIMEQPLCDCDQCQEDRRIKNRIFIIGGLKKTNSEQTIPIIQGVLSQKPCKCQEDYERRIEEYKVESKKKVEELSNSDGKEINKPEDVEKEKSEKVESEKTCPCKENNKKKIEQSLCDCDKCQEDRRIKNRYLIIGGLKKTDSEQIIPIIHGVQLKKPCKCREDYEKKIEEYEVESKKPCHCIKENKKIIEKPLCDCDKCQEDRRRKNTRFVIGGIKETENKKIIHIIHGIQLTKSCKCLEDYKKRITEYEDYQKRMKTVCELKQRKDKYIIGGVVITSEGPVYIISGMRPPIDCICAKQAREELAEKQRLAMAPHLPAGRTKYEISGVKETPQGSVFILNRALPKDDCACTKMQKKFEEEHGSCLKLYEGYLSKTKDDINEHMNDMLPEKRKGEPPSSTVKSIDVSNTNVENTNEKPARIELHDTCGKKDKKLCQTCATENAFSGITKECKNSMKEKKPLSICCGCSPKVETVPCTSCTCGVKKKEVPCIDCTCGPAEVEEEEVVEEQEIVEEEEEKKELKRFFIFDKFSCKYKWHLKVLKKALESMADDDYPLAKLPFCHKLPHFKLWMQMRCRISWDDRDKKKYTLKSKNLWKHTDICVGKLKAPKLQISKERAKELTWMDASYVRKITSRCIGKYYRELRQLNVDLGAEFFPTLFPYEFPFPTFRQCYFAYCAGKQSDVLSAFVWQKFETKDFSRRVSCL